jgi:thiol:disulfide interchange protein DsbD
VYAPSGKGKSLAPSVSWKNADILEEYWPDHVGLPNSDGGQSGYFGYDKDVTILYKLRVRDATKPIEYDLFYVACSDACVPTRSAGTLKLNGLLLKGEVEKVTERGRMAVSPLFTMILFGLLGGIVLNFLPCVFPIVSMKAFAIMKLARASSRIIRWHGISVSIGMITTFLLLGLVLLILREYTPGIGWGFYMQSPSFVFLLFIGFLVSGLHFFGIVHLGLPGGIRLKLPVKTPFISSFFSGILGAFTSASCAGPFAGIAISSAILVEQDFLRSACIFASLGIGAATPFLLISFYPKMIKAIPRPGKWLEIFKEFMGFAMLFSAIWPLWILSSQVGGKCTMLALACAVALSMFLWTARHAKKLSTYKVTATTGAVAVVCCGAFVMGSMDQVENEIIWHSYSNEIFNAALNNKKPVFLNFTASWCLNCQVNQTVFNDSSIVDEFKKGEIVAIKCDWTNRDEGVASLLRTYGAVSVPFYVFYPAANSDYVILPIVLTKANLLDVISRTRRREDEKTRGRKCWRPGRQEYEMTRGQNDGMTIERENGGTKGRKGERIGGRKNWKTVG